MIQRTSLSVTREGWYYLGMLGFIVAGAMIRDINLLYIMAGMMLGPLLFSIYAATKSLKRMTLARRFQPIVGAGDPMHIDVIAAKPKGSSRAFATVVQDQIVRKPGRRRSRVVAKLYFPDVQAGGSAEASYRVRFQRRGRYQLGPMTVSTSMPLGLIRVSSGGAENQHVLVSPRIGRLSPTWSRHLQLRNEGGQKSVRKRGKSEGDFYGMREWRDGDSRHWIHWRTSAKRNKLTVRQYEQRISQDLVVILDLWQPDRVDAPDSASELAISFVATLVVEQGKQGSTHLTVASASDSQFLLRGTSSSVFRNELMERLAVVEPSSRDKLPQLLAEVLSETASHAKVVLVSSQDRDLRDTDVFEAVWKRTDIRRSLHDVLKVNTSAPEFFDWFRRDDVFDDPQSPKPTLEQLAT